MRKGIWALLLMCSLAAMPAWAQETRGNINGTIKDAQGVIPGANVRITNIENGQTQTLTTNETGYFEAPLLQAGRYRVTVEMPNFKTLNQDVVLSVGQTLGVNLTLEVGNITESVNVTAEAPILDTTSVSSGQNFDRALIEGLPMAANQPILLSKFAQGIVGPTTQQLVLQGQIDGPNDGAGDPVGGVGQLQLLDRRRDQRRQQPPHVRVAELRHDRGDARRDVELRRLAGARHGREHLVEHARGLEPDARHVELPVLDEPDQLAEPAAEAGLRPAARNRRAVRDRPLAQRRVHARRAGGPSEDRERPQQAFLLLQLSAQLRRFRGPEHADVHGAREREAPRRRLLGPAHAGQPRPVPDLRSADRQAGSGAPGQLHPHAVPEQHHPERPVHERERHVQEPAVRALQGHGRGAKPELRRARADPARTTTTRAACRI